MKKYIKFGIAFIAMLGTNAFAEGNCPQGMYPIGGGNGGWQGCAPIPVGGSGGGGNISGRKWATRWGAIAVDSDNGRFGGIENETSESKAKKSSINECKKDGGKNCKAIAAYYNQCGAMAWGDKFVSSYSAPTINKAKDLALNWCNEKSPNCNLYYAGCSPPVQIR